MQTLSSTTELDKRMPKALNKIKVPASDNPQSLGKKVVMVYVRLDHGMANRTEESPSIDLFITYAFPSRN